MRWALTSLLLATVLVHHGLAHAQDVGADEVTLKNGGSVRGTIISSEPGANVKILEMGSKEPRTIPWAQVADVQKGKYAQQQQQQNTPPVQPGSAGTGYSQQPQEQPTPPVQQNVEPQPALGQNGVVRVHVVSPEPVTLLAHEIRTGAVGGYGFVIDRMDPVCNSPCDKVVDGSGGRYFNIGGEVPGSRLFTFSGMTGDVRVGVRPGSSAQLVGGYMSILVGGLGLAGGITMVAIGTVIANDASNPDPGTEWLIPGWIATGVGVAAIIGGIVLMVTGGTKVDVHPMHKHEARKPNYFAGEW